MKIAIAKVTKEVNSTYKPSIIESDFLEVRLKDRTSLLTPTFEIYNTDITRLTEVNYVVAKEFNRCYWITNITFTSNNIAELECKEDVLATYREQILNSTQFVMRSESEYSNAYTDPILPMQAFVEESYSVQTIKEFKKGFFVLGVGGGESLLGTNFYVMDAIMLGVFIKYIFNADNFAELIDNKVSKMFFNPMEYISTCIYFPYEFVADSEGIWSADKIKLGFYEWEVPVSIGSYCKEIPTPTVTIDKVYEYQLPVLHKYDDGNFRNFAPYTSYKVFLPFRGTIDLPNGLVGNAETIGFKTVCDLTSGKAFTDIYFMKSGEKRFLQREEYQIGVRIPITFIDNSPTGQVISGFSGALEKAYETGINAEGGALESLKAYGSSLLDSLSEGVENAVGVVTGGSNILSGGGMKLSVGGVGEGIYNNQIFMITLQQNPPTLPLNTFGAPLMQPRKLSSLSGYIEVANPEIMIKTATQTELLTIINFMKGGMRIV
jgi:hypothetical protein